MTASTDAAEAVAAAMAAVANLATMQTGAMAGGLADEAQTAADKAMMAYEHAKAASEAAAEAEGVPAAVEARIMAEAAMANAVMYGMTATEKAGEAETAAMAELMIVGTMKSVGETSIDAMAGASSMATGAGADAQTVITGLIKSINPMAEGERIVGVEWAAGTPDDLTTGGVDESKAANATKPAAYKQTAAARTFAIGKTLDSPDDMARLMLVTDHAGVNMVKVYAPATEAEGTLVMGTKAGYLSVVDGVDGNTDVNNVPLRSEGMFYAAAGADADLDHTDSIGTLTKPVEVFSYVNSQGTPQTMDDMREYATLTTTSTSESDGETTYTYQAGHDLIAPTMADGPDDMGDPDETRVTSGIPGPVAYQHLHFGAWASLGEAAKDGAQKVTGHGIGFVQSIGDGMTGADMPSTGSATYNGNWVATVQEAAGGVGLENGAATLAADFNKATVKATLTDLATLDGSIDGSMFSGTKATVGANAHGLTSGGKFSGSFNGGFYGPRLRRPEPSSTSSPRMAVPSAVPSAGPRKKTRL